MPSNYRTDDDERFLSDGSARSTRRRVLAAGAGVLAGLAGCSEQTEPPGTDPTESPPGSPETPSDVPTDPGPAPALSGPWPTVHADAANTGAIDAAGPRGAGSVRWRSHVSLETGMWVEDGPDGPVAVQENGRLVAYDDAGNRRWEATFPDEIRAAPVVAADGTVVACSRDGTVAAYEPDGTRRWRRTTPEGLFAPHANDATPLRLAGDQVFLAHPRGALLAFGLGTGTRRWAVDAPTRPHRPAVAEDSVIVVGAADDRRKSVIRSHRLTNGTDEWSETVDRSIGIGPGIADGVVYLGDIDGLLVARDTSDGREGWRVRLPDDPWISTIPVVFGGQVWVGTLSEGLFAVQEGGVHSRVEMGTSTSPAVGDGRLYVGSTGFGDAGTANGTVVALDTEGTELWRTGTRGQPNAQLAYRDGRVTVATETGVVDALDADDGERVWRAYERPEELPSPVVGDGAVYCGSRRDWVTGYVGTDGTSHLWGVGFDDPAPGAPVVAGETVVAGSHGGDVAGTPVHEYADPPSGRLTITPTPSQSETEVHIDAPLPEPRWRIDLDGPVGDFGYGDEGAYVGSGDAVVALTAAGDVRWETGVGEPVRAAPAAADGTVYAATEAGTLLALDATDGEERWRESLGESATAPVITSVDGEARLLVGTDTGVVTVGAASGEERWRTGTARVRGSPAVTEELAVVGDGDGVLRGLALADGTERWRVETGGAIHGSPAVGDGYAYVGSRDRQLYGVAIADGSVDWKIELRDWVDGSPALAYGALFVLDQSGTLTAVVGER